MQKELIEKSKNVKNCTICGLNNHDESTCRRKKIENNDKKPNQNKSSNWKNNFRYNRDEDKTSGESSNSKTQDESSNRYPQKDSSNSGRKNQNFIKSVL